MRRRQVNYTEPNQTGDGGGDGAQIGTNKESQKAQVKATAQTKEAGNTASKAGDLVNTSFTKLSSVGGSLRSALSGLSTGAGTLKTALTDFETKLLSVKVEIGGTSTATDSLKAFAVQVDRATEKLKKLKVGGSTNVPQAWGGRIGSEMNNVTVGEDGPEYIIPITKPERAMSLINQMFGEMGMSAVNRLNNDFGFGLSGTVGNALATGASSLGNIVMNNTFNIHAPVNIVVNSSAASADDVGSYAYNAAERHLVRTLRGVYA